MYFNPLFSTLLVQAVIDKLLHFSQLDAQYINQANLDFSSSRRVPTPTWCFPARGFSPDAC